MERKIFEVKLERKEWIKLNFIIAYRNQWVIWISIAGLAMLYTVIDYIVWNTYNAPGFPITQLLFAILIVGLIPISTYIKASKDIKSNPWLCERARYDMDSSKISVQGNSYELSMDWTKINAIKELKDWFVIYSEPNRGFFIPKRVFKSEEEQNNFRNDMKERPLALKKLK